MKWPPPWPFILLIHLNKSYDLGIPPMFGKINTRMDET
jgi:hypothetical protein